MHLLTFKSSHLLQAVEGFIFYSMRGVMREPKGNVKRVVTENQHLNKAIGFSFLKLQQS